MQKQQVVVIGGGVIGVSCAYFLASDGHDVTLIERAEIGSGCSYGNAGLICPSHAIPIASPEALAMSRTGGDRSPIFIPDRPGAELKSWLRHYRAASTEKHVHRTIPVLYQLMKASVELYRGLAAKAEGSFGFEQNGSITICKTKASFAGLRRETDLLAHAGVEVRTLTAREAAEMEPAVSPSIAGGVYFPIDAQVIPFNFVRSLGAEARKLGVKIYESTEVLELKAGRSKIASVSTTRGDFQPDTVVLAAGSWSPLVTQSLGLPLPVQAAKGYSITIKPRGRALRIPLSLREARVSVMPMGGAVRFAGTLEMAGLDLSYNLNRVNAVRDAAKPYMVNSCDGELIEIWRGLRPCSPDGLPIVDRHQRLGNLLIAAGHAVLGMSLGPITGKLVSEMVSGESPSFDLAPLRLNRFA